MDTVYFGGLDPRVTPRTLADLCTQAGPVATVHWPADARATGTERGPFAFVRFADAANGTPAAASAAHAVALFSAGGVALYGRRPRVELAAGGGVVGGRVGGS
jgi:hypothetical protein